MIKYSLHALKKIYTQGLHATKVKKLTVKAIITIYNEIDIIEQVVVKLLKQGIKVHIIDNWSTDGSYEALQKASYRDSELSIERFPIDKPDITFNLVKLLHRIEKIAIESSENWIIHYDADEIRKSCWPEISLQKGIEIVDMLGFNAIDFTVLDFRPINAGFQKGVDPEKFFKYFEFPQYLSHYLQIKAWKNLHTPIDLITHGGHDVLFAGKKVYPLKFLTKHYSYRSPVQAKRKILKHRISRLNKEEVSKGWHKHYFEATKLKRSKYLWYKEDLLKFDQTFYKKYFWERLTGKNAITDLKVIPFLRKNEILEEELDTIKRSKFYRLWRLYCIIKDKLMLSS